MGFRGGTGAVAVAAAVAVAVLRPPSSIGEGARSFGRVKSRCVREVQLPVGDDDAGEFGVDSVLLPLSCDGPPR
jgi:hypothetical protein